MEYNELVASLIFIMIYIALQTHMNLFATQSI